MTIGLKKVIADKLKHKTRLKHDISSAHKELKKARVRLKNFGLLAEDTTFGKYYVDHVRDERALIKRLQEYINRYQSRLVEVGKEILALVHATAEER